MRPVTVLSRWLQRVRGVCCPWRRLIQSRHRALHAKQRGEPVSVARRRIHIQNPPAEANAIRLEADRLELALAARGLASRFAISEGEGSDELPEAASDAEILFLLTKSPLDEARRVAPKLKWVQTAYAGMEETVPSLPTGLQVSNASGVHAEKGAEFILGACLMLNSAFPQFIENKVQARWDPIYTPTLRTRRITMLGVGAIGGTASVLLKRIGCTVWGVTPSRSTAWWTMIASTTCCPRPIFLFRPCRTRRKPMA